MSKDFANGSEESAMSEKKEIELKEQNATDKHKDREEDRDKHNDKDKKKKRDDEIEYKIFEFETKNEQNKKETYKIKMPERVEAKVLLPFETLEEQQKSKKAKKLWTLSDGTGFVLRESSKMLAAYLPTLKRYIKGKIVLELGSGFGMPSIAAIKNGAKYTYITDKDPLVLNLIPKIFEVNDIPKHKYHCQSLLWNNWTECQALLQHLESTHPHQFIDVIFCSDCIYTQKGTYDLLCTWIYLFWKYFHGCQQQIEKERQRSATTNTTTPNYLASEDSIEMSDTSNVSSLDSFLSTLPNSFLLQSRFRQTLSCEQIDLIYSDAPVVILSLSHHLFSDNPHNSFQSYWQSFLRSALSFHFHCISLFSDSSSHLFIFSYDDRDLFFTP
ncbi:hypothetical protein RFI_11034 [Reticulomyxa filosa]|uniref:Uncharacterized protein n=1 Tax=Reticulomyxa filosa TaxID=46433 RepID=X6NJC2_RETFI|nr:hypothetical protein RFI_11034 [Reticulomyxa filosa]|eukprot:ETO26101.1 hypothetical protein RFI_11034 [Reticulomyxa filosa]